MYSRGIKASDLANILLELVKTHGDKEVWVSGGDYPEGAKGARYKKKSNDNYIPDGVIVI
jgi:hypothetical protein